MTATYPELRAPVDALVATFSAYARVTGPRQPGDYYCPLEYGIPATVGVLRDLARHRSAPRSIYRGEIRKALRHVDKSEARIAEYVEWLGDRVARQEERWPGSVQLSWGVALATARTYLHDLREAHDVLEALVPKAPVR